MRCGPFRICINDPRNFYVLYKDIFVKRIYHFTAERPDPLILDCGSNIGVSIFYFKHLYPEARIVGFEPDARVFSYLQANVVTNALEGVRLVHAALSSKEGVTDFFSDGKYAAGLSEHLVSGGARDWIRSKVSSARLRDYLTDPVDLLKMNIEGAEYEVLKDSEDRLQQINEMIIEYHHLPGLPRTLHSILEILDRQGFEYLINDFDSQTNGSVKPPFNLTPETRYFLLIYAKRLA
jgi:FkbM family methyltransferase